MHQLKIIRNCLPGAFMLFMVQVSCSQDLDPAGRKHKNSHFIVAVQFQRLRSTHSQTIYGASIFFGRQIHSSLTAGIGCEVSYVERLYTHNKSFNIFYFRPIPIYGEVRFISQRNSRFVPYAHLATGMSSITYHLQRYDPIIGSVQHKNVYQYGFFVNVGFGLLFSVTKHIAPSIGVSFKGFHISGNPYEINPHGITLQAGVVWRPD